MTTSYGTRGEGTQKSNVLADGKHAEHFSGNKEAHHFEPYAELAAIHSLPPPPSNIQQATSSMQQAHPENAYIINIHCKKGQS